MTEDSKRFIEQPVGDETLIYDLQEKTCHSLSPEASLVWNGLKEDKSSESVLESFVEAFPDQRDNASEIVDRTSEALRDITTAPAVGAEGDPLLGRRRVLQVAGLALITTILAPKAASAASGPALVFGFANFGYYGSPTLTECGGTAGGATIANVSVLDDVQAAVNNDSISLLLNDANLGVSPSSTPKELRYSYRCYGGAPSATIRICKNATLTITCPPPGV